MRMVADDIPPNRMNARPIAAFVADFPLPEGEKQKLIALYTEKRDVLKGQTAKEKEDYLWTLSYRDFVMKHWGLSDLGARTFQRRSNDFFAIGVDGVPAHDAMDTGYPGFQGLGLELSAEAKAELNDPYIYHFPDGNASIARSLVRKLIPQAAAGTRWTISSRRHSTTRSSINRRRPCACDSPARSCACAICLRVSWMSATSRAAVCIACRPGAPIYAGYGMMLPYICPDVGAKQHEALVRRREGAARLRERRGRGTGSPG